MMKKSIFTGIRELQFLKAAPLALLILQGNQVSAENALPKVSEGTSALEIMGYVAMIIGLVAFAWVFGAWQSKNSKQEAAAKPHKHFEHPNDPHFRKLKKKTS